MRPLHSLVAALALLGASAGPACTRPQSSPTAPTAPSPAPPPRPCVTASDCYDGQQCEAGVCTACEEGECSRRNVDGECDTDQHCPINHYCVSSYHREPWYRVCRVNSSVPPNRYPRDALLTMETAHDELRDYTATLVRRERVDGELRPPEVIDIKYREPHSVHAHWIGDVYLGRRALYIGGHNDNRVRLHPGWAPGRATHDQAMQDSRRLLTQRTLGALIELIIRDLRSSEQHPEDHVVIKYLGETPGRAPTLRCFDVRFPLTGGYHAPHLRICTNAATNLLHIYKAWDEHEQLIADYEFRDLQVNVGLSSREFDPHGPDFNY